MKLRRLSSTTDSSAGPAPPPPDVTSAITEKSPEQSAAAPSPPSSPQKAGRGYTEWLLAGLLLLLTFLLGSYAASNADFWTHLAAGRLLAQGEYQFGVDPFTFTAGDVTWVNHSWLYDLLIYDIYEQLGGADLVIAKALLLVVLTAILLCIRRRDHGLWLPCVCIGLAVLVMSPRFLLQPTCISFLFLSLTLYLLTRETPGTVWRLWLLPPLFALWVNLDGLFILGPLTVALYTLGVLVQGWMGQSPRLKARTLGLVLLAGLGACLLNPHLFGAFELPPELAYLVVQVTDGLGIDTPSWLAAGGRTIQILRKDNPTLFASSLTSLRPAITTANFAALAYFLLLALGLLSFALPRRDNQGCFWPGLAVCLFFALLSLAELVLVPFFAIVAGPFAVLNFQNFNAGRSADNSEGQRASGSSRAGRWATVLVFLVFLGLAWPGWLHGQVGDFASVRRVAWKVPVDPSLHQAARRLNELQDKTGLGRVFAFSPDLACYCAWFAPDVKGFLDFRFSLFADVADEFVESRRALVREGRDFISGKAVAGADAYADWRQLAEKYQIHFLALTNCNRVAANKAVAYRLWLQDAAHVPLSPWPLLYEDGRTMIFGWSALGAGGLDRERIDEARLVFGLVPIEDRPPTQGVVFPGEPRNAWLKYASGEIAMPLAGDTARLYHEQHQLLFKQFEQRQFVAGLVLQAGLFHGPVGLSAAVPGSVSWVGVLAALHLSPLPPYRPPGKLAAAPVLAVRHARRAVADAPYHPQAYWVLFQACQSLKQLQEDLWASDRGQSASLRSSLRQLQEMAALKAYLDLQPDDSAAQELMAGMYLQIRFLDAALERMRLAYKYRDSRLARIPDKKFREAAGKELEKNLSQKVRMLAAEVDRRLDKFDLSAPGRDIAGKFHLALNEKIKVMDNDKREREVPMGLALKALAILQSADLQTLKPAEQFFVISNQLDLLLKLGRVKEVGEVLDQPNIKQIPTFYHFEMLWAFATGNYARADAALAKQSQGVIPTLLLGLQRSMSPSLAGLNLDPITLLVAPGLLQNAANFSLLRGLLALERGETRMAEEFFQQARRLAGTSIYLPDRPIAEAYLELLRAAAPD